MNGGILLPDKFVNSSYDLMLFENLLVGWKSSVIDVWMYFCNRNGWDFIY